MQECCSTCFTKMVKTNKELFKPRMTQLFDVFIKIISDNNSKSHYRLYDAISSLFEILENEEEIKLILD